MKRGQLRKAAALLFLCDISMRCALTRNTRKLTRSARRYSKARHKEREKKIGLGQSPNDNEEEETIQQTMS